MNELREKNNLNKNLINDIILKYNKKKNIYIKYSKNNERYYLYNKRI